MCREVGNVKDSYTISILQGPDVVVAHLPQKISRISTNVSSWNVTQFILLCYKYHTDLITAKVSQGFF